MVCSEIGDNISERNDTSFKTPIRIHEKDDFVCRVDGCNKQLNSKQGLSNHQRFAHPQYIKPGKVYFECPVKECFVKYCRYSTLTRHMQKKHKDKDLQLLLSQIDK